MSEPNKRESDLALDYLRGTDFGPDDHERLWRAFAIYRAELLAPFERIADKFDDIPGYAQACVEDLREAIRRAKEGV